ncbi:hypothetical protein BCR42DRAFT_433434 [Absidia repens]|uniref:Uncharacterized protein n=1 Tax=Absidia repens TaxID=90262 RepID=A0A1X2ITM0_9FUNG|nr:hypothetical protein BCR42DRAFT_433434 [Absidia repens]
MVTFLQKSKLGERLTRLKNFNISQDDHAGFTFVCAENPAPQSCNEQIPDFETAREDHLSHHVKWKAPFSGQVKTQFGKCIDLYHDVVYSMKGRRHRNTGVTDCVYIPYESHATPMASNFIADQAQDNQLVASDSSSCALATTSLASTDDTFLSCTLSYCDFNYLPVSTVCAPSSGLVPKNEQITLPSFANASTVLDCLSVSCAGQPNNLLTLVNPQNQCSADGYDYTLSIKTICGITSMVLTLQLYQKHAPLRENKKAFIALPGSIDFLKNILKNIGNFKFTGISPPLDVYKSLIKHAYGATCGNQIIKYLQTDVDQISPFLLKKAKKEHEQAQAQQSEITLECSLTNANDDMDWSRTFGDQDDYMDESDSSLSTNTIDEPFLDFSQLILTFMNQQHQFSKTQQSQVYLFLEAFTPIKGSGPSNNAAKNSNAFSIKNSLLSDLAQNKNLLPEKEPEIKDNVANLSSTESITRKRQRHQKPQPLVKRQRKDGETASFSLCKETLSEHPPTSIAQSCKPPRVPRASGQQNSAK